MSKRNYLLVSLMFFMIGSSFSQGSITGITISPSNPTIDDTITVYADIQFSNSSCEFFNSMQNISGNTINVTTQHCLGMLTSICYIVDTFKIDPLPAGNYVFDLILTSDINFGIIPCTGGNSPNDNDTLHFVVIDPSGINDNLSSEEFSFYPNPCTGVFNFETSISYDQVIMYSSKGQEIFTQYITGHNGAIRLDIEPGFYFIRFRMENGLLSSMKKILVIH